MVSKMAKTKPKSKSTFCPCRKFKCCLIILSIFAIVFLSLYVFCIFKRMMTSSSVDIFSKEKPLPANDPRVVQYLRDHHLIPPSSASVPYDFKCTEPSCGTRPCVIESHNKIKKFVLQLLENKRNGFFVESGSNNGEYMSATIYLEKDYNWTGLLIEPDAVFFNESRKVNRKAWLSNTCLSQKNPKKVQFNHTGESHPKTVNKNLDSNPDENEKSAIVTVECFPLYTYLLALNVTQIDFLSLNIPGSDQLLKKFPFGKISVKVLKFDESSLKGPIKDLAHFLQGKKLFPVTNTITNSSNCVKDHLFAHTSLFFNLVQ